MDSAQAEAAIVNARRAQVRDLVTSWLLAIFAIGTGLYLFLGGASHLTSPAYTYVLKLVGGNYLVVAVILLLAAAVNIAAVLSGNEVAIAIGAILVGMWHIAVSLLMGAAVVSFPGTGGNLNCLNGLLLGLLYMMRAYNKFHPISLSSTMATISLVAMWFV